MPPHSTTVISAVPTVSLSGVQGTLGWGRPWDTWRRPGPHNSTSPIHMWPVFPGLSPQALCKAFHLLHPHRTWVCFSPGWVLTGLRPTAGPIGFTLASGLLPTLLGPRVLGLLSAPSCVPPLISLKITVPKECPTDVMCSLPAEAALHHSGSGQQRGKLHPSERFHKWHTLPGWQHFPSSHLVLGNSYTGWAVVWKGNHWKR